jgi:hypothetical protein
MPGVNFKSWKAELFRSGDLGVIRLGIPKAKLLSTLGEPDSVELDEKGPNPTILKYEDMRFHFDSRDILRIIDTPRVDEIPHPLLRWWQHEKPDA